MKTLRSLLVVLFALALSVAAQVPTSITGYASSVVKKDAELVLPDGERYLTLMATGPGPAATSWRWTKDGADVVLKNGGLIAAQYLYIPQPTAADAGLYTVTWNGAASLSYRVSTSTFVPAAVLPLPRATPLGTALVLLPLGSTGLSVRWTDEFDREIPGSPRDQLVFTPTQPGWVIARLWNTDPNASVSVQGILYDDALKVVRWAPGVHGAAAFTFVR